MDVVVVDDDRPGRATRAGAGIVSRPGRHRNPGEPGFELAARAVDAYPSIVAKIGGSAGLLDVIGALFVAPAGPQLEETYARLRDVGASRDPRLLDPAHARQMFPYLRSDLAAVLVPEAARVDGEVVRTELLRAASSSGARLLTGPTTLDLAGHRVVGAVIGGRREGADAVVVAAGAWSADVLRPAGVNVPVDAQRGQILHLRVPGVDTSALPIVHPIAASHYLLPFADSRIVVGATRETGSGYDPRLTAGGVARVLDDALGVAPGLANATLAELRVGLRPATPDGDPILGRVSGYEELWIATGMGPTGLTLGPYSGRLVAHALLGRTPEVDLVPFALDRRMPTDQPGDGKVPTV
jgi:D-amino-acid dehydrogenase